MLGPGVPGEAMFKGRRGGTEYQYPSGGTLRRWWEAKGKQFLKAGLWGPLGVLGRCSE